MLYLTDSDGVRTNSVSATYKETSGVPGVLVTVAARVYETDTTLGNRYVTASLDWNDGSGETVSFGSASINSIAEGYWTVSTSKRLLPGSCVPSFKAENFRLPVADIARLNYQISITPYKSVYNPQKYIYGPILPRDSGNPNRQNWEFDIDSDVLILRSSVKMLLLTAKGERVMEPNYGTNLRRIIFDLNIPSIDGIIRDEIVSAFARWEPRVELGSLNTERDSLNRSVYINLVLVSKLSQQPFETSIQFLR